MNNWSSVETAPEFKAVLAFHADDLYPVVAYRIGEEWFGETEGPEDLFYGRGRHEKLYRTPTHWMPLPEVPLTAD
jgi:hypothetical protein